MQCSKKLRFDDAARRVGVEPIVGELHLPDRGVAAYEDHKGVGEPIDEHHRDERDDDHRRADER